MFNISKFPIPQYTPQGAQKPPSPEDLQATGDRLQKLGLDDSFLGSLNELAQQNAVAREGASAAVKSAATDAAAGALVSM